MKKGRLFLTLFTFLFFTNISNAQVFTAKAGFNLADIKERGGAFFQDYDMKPGFHIGLAAEFSLNNWLSVEPAILYNNKGASAEEKLLGYKVSGRLNLHYLDIPVNFKVSQRTQGDMKIYAMAGPYLGIGLAGNTKSELTGASGTDTNKQALKWGSDSESDLKRTEFGATFGAGIEIKMLQFGISYDLGLSNIAPKSDDDVSAKNRVLRFTVGYRFGKN